MFIIISTHNLVQADSSVSCRDRILKLNFHPAASLHHSVGHMVPIQEDLLQTESPVFAKLTHAWLIWCCKFLCSTAALRMVKYKRDFRTMERTLYRIIPCKYISIYICTILVCFMRLILSTGSAYQGI